ncbi:serine hydrolase [Phytohabitans rumicis]|uniref:Serine hydrolase n=1 Tax=Phytohabitans rumicis TaxID=1076125 RepID=A0A6V8LQC1_9ACTN|nr:serine hydrolase [Phytohabitans rumicis]GFJ96307.1 serine hydrolase [Phytohabitans rumicis]
MNPVEKVFADAGVRGWLHAVDIDTGAEVGVDADDAVVTASVFKVFTLVELCRRAALGALDLTTRVPIPAGDRSDGGLGLSAMRDATELSLRDLAYLMISISDNHAADVLTQLLGEEPINATLRSLGLTRSGVVGTCRSWFAQMREDLGIAAFEEFSAYDDAMVARLRAARGLNPAHASHTTPREITTLLSRIWRADGLPADACAEIRHQLGLQVWPQRLTSGFPRDDVKVSGKTGTVPFVFNEAGVVEYPDGGRYAVGVFLRLPG